MTQTLFDTWVFCHVSNTSTALIAAPFPKVATANNCKHRPVLCKSFSLLSRHPRHHCHSLSVILPSYLALAWGRRPAACGSGSTEPEAPQRTGRWPARRRAGWQPALWRRTESVCEETHRYERTGPVKWGRDGKVTERSFTVTMSAFTLRGTLFSFITWFHIFLTISCAPVWRCLTDKLFLFCFYKYYFIID